MDAFEALFALPRLAQLALRDAVVQAVARGRLAPRSLIDDALLRFETHLARGAADGVRPAALFAERDRIVRELRAFIESRLAVRLAALSRSRIVASGGTANPWDLIVRDARGRCFGIVFRRMPADAAKLRVLQRVGATISGDRRVHGGVVFDWSTGRAHILTAQTRIAERREGLLAS